MKGFPFAIIGCWKLSLLCRLLALSDFLPFLLTFLSEEGNRYFGCKQGSANLYLYDCYSYWYWSMRALIPEPSSSLVFMLPSRDAKEEGRLTTVDSVMLWIAIFRTVDWRLGVECPLWIFDRKSCLLGFMPIKSRRFSASARTGFTVKLGVNTRKISFLGVHT